VGLANGHYSGGFIEGDELIVAAYWGSSTAQRGMLMGIDVNTGDRRLISGSSTFNWTPTAASSVMRLHRTG
jgi:hypothetical protein